MPENFMTTNCSNELPVAKPRKWSKTFLRILGLGVVAMVALGFLVVVFENWRGRRAWEAYRVEAESRGVVLQLSVTIPPLIPEGSNVAAIPMLSALFDYHSTTNGEVRWKDSNLVNRVQSVSAFVTKVFADSGPNANWYKGTTENLEAIQKNLLKQRENLAVSTEPSTPARTILTALDEFGTELSILEEGFKRPQVRFPAHYEEGFACLLPTLSVMKGFSRLSLLKSSAYLAEGKTDEAFNQVLFSLRCGEVVGTNPLLISALVQLAIDWGSVSGIYEGLVGHRWTDAQIQGFTTVLRQRDVYALLRQSMQLERAIANDFYDRSRRGFVKESLLDLGSPFQDLRMVPSAILYQNQRRQNQFYDAINFDGVREHGLSTFSKDAGMEQLTNGFWPYRALSAMLAPAIHSCLKKTVRGRVTLDLAILACELERYRIAKGTYPETLAELVPQFLKAIPHDAASGGALHYHREKNDRFVLYSVGSDLKDDLGDIGKDEAGDWTWRMPKSLN